jgi:hypothetical protein
MRLITGEDIIANVTNTDGVICAEHPIVIITRQSQTGELNLMIAPLIAIKPDSKIFLDPSSIVYTYSAPTDLESKYREITTGLITSSGLITG